MTSLVLLFPVFHFFIFSIDMNHIVTLLTIQPWKIQSLIIPADVLCWRINLRFPALALPVIPSGAREDDCGKEIFTNWIKSFSQIPALSISKLVKVVTGTRHKNRDLIDTGQFQLNLFSSYSGRVCPVHFNRSARSSNGRFISVGPST